jgi:hypothetical protein
MAFPNDVEVLTLGELALYHDARFTGNSVGTWPTVRTEEEEDVVPGMYNIYVTFSDTHLRVTDQEYERAAKEVAEMDKKNLLGFSRTYGGTPWYSSNPRLPRYVQGILSPGYYAFAMVDPYEMEGVFRDYRSE